MISPPMFRPLTVLAQLHIEENDLHSEDEWKMGGNMRPPPEAPLVERRWSGECWPTISWGYTLSPLRGSTALYWDLPTLTKKNTKEETGGGRGRREGWRHMIYHVTIIFKHGVWVRRNLSLQKHHGPCKHPSSVCRVECAVCSCWRWNQKRRFGQTKRSAVGGRGL